MCARSRTGEEAITLNRRDKPSYHEAASAIKGDPRARLAAWIVTLLMGLCIIGWFMGEPPPELRRDLPPDPFTTPGKAGDRIRKLAEQHGNNFDRLSADDRMILNKIAAGHGRELLEKTVRELKTKKANQGALTAP